MPTGLSRVYWLGKAFPFKEKLSQKIIRSVKAKPLQIVPLQKGEKSCQLIYTTKETCFVFKACF